MLKTRPVKHITPVLAHAWQQHLSNVFTPSRGSHSPQPQGHGADPSSNEHCHSHASHQPFYCPDESQICKIVALHISQLRATSSPGFDSIMPSFLKYACTVVRQEDGRVFQQINVLVPIISKLFHLVFTKASIPHEWKTAILFRKKVQLHTHAIIVCWQWVGPFIVCTPMCSAPS